MLRSEAFVTASMNPKVAPSAELASARRASVGAAADRMPDENERS